MTELLIRLLVRDREDTDTPEVRSSYGPLAGGVGIGCNLLLFAGKLLIGFLTVSTAIMADAFNNLSDAASSVISLVSMRMARRGADQEHPFGHGRVEYIAALIVSLLIIDVGFGFFKTSVGKIIRPEKMIFSGPALAVLILSIVVKVWMFLFYRKIGNKINSNVIKASSMDSLSDCLTTGITLVSLVIYKIFGLNLDGYAGLIVSLIIMWAGIGIAKDMLEPLIGQQADEELVGKVKDLVLEEPEISGTHDLVIHNYGPGVSMAVVHAEVSKDLSLEEAHAAADKAEQHVLHDLGVNLVIHVDPTDPENSRVQKLKRKIERVVKVLDPRLSIHDFQAVFSEEETYAAFDLEIPYDITMEQEHQLASQIQTIMQEIDDTLHLSITVDRGYLTDNVIGTTN